MAASSCSRWITAYFAESTSSCPTVRLADVASVDLGRQRAPKYETGPNMRPYIRAANLKDGRLSLDDVLSMHFNRDEIERLRLRKGDVLVTEGCGSLAEIGANAVWNEELPGEVCFQNTVLRLRARAGRLLQEYLQVWASQAYVRGEFADVASGTSIYHLGAKRTAKMLLPLPGPDEQRTIVARVQACQSVERESARSAEQLKSVRRDLLRKLMNEPSGGNVL